MSAISASGSRSSEVAVDASCRGCRGGTGKAFCGRIAVRSWLVKLTIALLAPSGRLGVSSEEKR